jgi:hypothetical protein
MPIIFPASAVLSLLERGLGFVVDDVEALNEEDDEEGPRLDASPMTRRERMDPGA